jgi:poly(3-hydroxybutyrate) depolymerase
MPRRLRVLLATALLIGAVASDALAQDLPRGTIVDEVTCAGYAGQSYALYVPRAYSPERKWNLLLAFHPAAQGRLMVEKFQAAAEQYGYIVAGSNTSRNGLSSVSMSAMQCMSVDVGRRFSIDAKRVYLTGMSGGARVAMQVALGRNDIAGVIASSAGYPDGRPRASVPFAVFGTAGSNDFNYLEMRQLDRKLTSPHHLAVFFGGHTLPPDGVAFEAIEWMELQAMKAGRRTRDEALVERLFEKRQRAVAAAVSPADTVQRLDTLVSDFTGLRDVSADAGRAQDLSKQPDVKEALARQRADDKAEARTLADVYGLESRLSDERDQNRREDILSMLREQLKTLARAANAPEGSPGRTRARRLLRAISAVGPAGPDRERDHEYRWLLDEYRLRERSPDPRSPIPDPRSPIPDPRSLIPDPRSPIPDPRSLIPDP